MSRQVSAYQYSHAALAHRPVVEGYTIDDPSTLDMDDGLWVEKRPNGWNVLISIADVSSVVPPGSAHDRRARAQGFSLYNPAGNRPMFADELDRDRLSLVEGVLRPAVTVEVVFDNALNIVDSAIYRSAFYNRKKLSYEKFLEQSGDPSHRFFLWSHLAQKLFERRRANGSLTLEDINKGLVLDADGRLRGNAAPSHRGYVFVQEMAILANSIVGKYMRDHDVPALYRNHAADAVDPELGPRLLYNVREAIQHDDDKGYDIAIKRLRLWFQRARYETDVKGHFGLALPEYLHFTSPIRRYADLAVHRNLLAHIEGRQPVHSQQELQALGAHLNARSDAERDLHQSEMLKEILYQRMHRRVRSPGAVFNNLHTEELRMALFVARYEGIENRHLAAEVKRLAERRVLGPMISEYLLKDVQGDTPYWRDLQAACRVHQPVRPGLAGRFAQSVAHWAPMAKLQALQAGGMMPGLHAAPV